MNFVTLQIHKGRDQHRYYQNQLEDLKDSVSFSICGLKLGYFMIRGVLFIKHK